MLLCLLALGILLSEDDWLEWPGFIGAHMVPPVAAGVGLLLGWAGSRVYVDFRLCYFHRKGVSMCWAAWAW